MMRAEYPYSYRWLAHMDDLSGNEGQWSEEPSACALELTRISDEVYAPFLAANAAAAEAGEESFSFKAIGRSNSQGTFKYQLKCLADLRGRYAALSEADRTRAGDWIGNSWRGLLSE